MDSGLFSVIEQSLHIPPVPDQKRLIVQPFQKMTGDNGKDVASRAYIRHIERLSFFKTQKAGEFMGLVFHLARGPDDRIYLRMLPVSAKAALLSKGKF